MFSASHNDPVRQELHGHSYEVTAWWIAAPDLDAVEMQAVLKRAVAKFDHKTLPAQLSRGEAMALELLQSMPGCVGVDLSRPLERIHVKVRRP